MEEWNGGGMEWWRNGMVEEWNVGIMEDCMNVGLGNDGGLE